MGGGGYIERESEREIERERLSERQQINGEISRQNGEAFKEFDSLLQSLNSMFSHSIHLQSKSMLIVRSLKTGSEAGHERSCSRSGLIKPNNLSTQNVHFLLSHAH